MCITRLFAAACAMLAQGRLSSTAIFLAIQLFCLSPLTGATELQVGKAQEGVLQDGKGPAYTVALKAGDYLQADFELHDTELIVTVYDPSGAKFRAFRLDRDYGSQVVFVAESSGTYRLAVEGTERSHAGNFSLTLTRVVSLDERLAPAPPPEPYESADIKRLKAELSAGKADAVGNFWKYAAQKTTPWLESIEGDHKYMLVTFLWQGNGATRNVVVQWFPYASAWPDDYRMIHLADTNVWYKTLKVNRQTRLLYRLAPNASYLRPTRDDDPAQLRMFMASGQVDPLNPKHWLHDPVNPDPAKYQDWSVAELPDAAPQPWAEPRAGVPAGMVEQQQFKSALLDNERELSVYLPPGYDAKRSQPYGLLVLFDEGAYVQTKDGPPLIPMPTTVDNLIAEGRIPPILVLLIGNPPGLRNAELACNKKFLDALNGEMIPWVRQNYNVTHDPGMTIVGGLSLGGLAAACAALYYPQTFGNVLAQSGSFWWTPPSGDNPIEFDAENEPDWVSQQFVAKSRIAVRFYLTAGTGEFDPSGRGRDILLATRHLRDVLLAKGYEVHYQEYFSAHDFLSWRGYLADGLIALIGTSREVNH